MNLAHYQETLTVGIALVLHCPVAFEIPSYFYFSFTKYGVFPGPEVKQKKTASVGIQCELLTDKVDQGVVTTEGQPLACLLVIHSISNVLILF